VYTPDVAPTPATAQTTEPPFLTRIRLRARRRILWLRDLWAADATGGMGLLQRLAEEQRHALQRQVLEGQGGAVPQLQHVTARRYAAHRSDARVAEVLQEHPDNDELKAALVLDASPKKITAMLQNGEQIAIVGEGLKPATSGLAEKANPKVRVRRGAVIRVILGSKGDWTITQLPEVEGAFVAMDTRTGAIRAMNNES